MIYRQEKEPYLFNFSGTAQQILFNSYGDPCTKGWGTNWLMNWRIRKDFEWFPADTICVHNAFQPLLFNAFKQLEDLDLHSEINTFEEAFCIRFINGSTSVLSVHSWGAALDLNAEENPLGSNGIWSKEFISVMHQNGIYCGQRWDGRKDPMHFSMVNG